MRYNDISLQTKRQLSASLKKFMKKKIFSKITIKEIIEDCNVNRKTFYYHFEDIYALLRWTFEQEAIEIVKKFDLKTDYTDAILFVMGFVEQNDHILNCAIDSIGICEMKRFFYKDFCELTRSIIKLAEKETETNLDKDYEDFLVSFYTEALGGTLLDWITNPGNLNKELTAQRLSNTIRYSLIGGTVRNNIKNFDRL